MRAAACTCRRMAAARRPPRWALKPDGGRLPEYTCILRAGGMAAAAGGAARRQDGRRVGPRQAGALDEGACERPPRWALKPAGGARQDGNRHACPRAAARPEQAARPLIRPGMGPRAIAMDRAPAGRQAAPHWARTGRAAWQPPACLPECRRPARWALKPSGRQAAGGPARTGGPPPQSGPAWGRMRSPWIGRRPAGRRRLPEYTCILRAAAMGQACRRRRRTEPASPQARAGKRAPGRPPTSVPCRAQNRKPKAHRPAAGRLRQQDGGAAAPPEPSGAEPESKGEYQPEHDCPPTTSSAPRNSRRYFS